MKKNDKYIKALHTWSTINQLLNADLICSKRTRLAVIKLQDIVAEQFEIIFSEYREAAAEQDKTHPPIKDKSITSTQLEKEIQWMRERREHAKCVAPSEN